MDMKKSNRILLESLAEGIGIMIAIVLVVILVSYFLVGKEVYPKDISCSKLEKCITLKISCYNSTLKLIDMPYLSDLDMPLSIEEEKMLYKERCLQ